MPICLSATQVPQQPLAQLATDQGWLARTLSVTKDSGAERVAMLQPRALAS